VRHPPAGWPTNSEERSTVGHLAQYDLTSLLAGAKRAANMKTFVTGIKPTGPVHIGNYLGAMRPALRLSKGQRLFCSIADYHAFTTPQDPARLREHTYDLAAAWLAAGLDPASAILFRQSSIAEVFELAWIFDCLITTGRLERGHAYKDALTRGESPTAGLFNYPVLMAADVVLFDADLVPVGTDQKQHVEVARDLAIRLNRRFREGTVVVPEALVTNASVVPGTDGRKMSKSHGNTLPVFAPEGELRSAIMNIKTSPEPLEAPKDPEGSIVVELYSFFASESDVAAMKDDLRRGAYGWRQAKEVLFEAVNVEIGGKRGAFVALRADESKLGAILDDGAARARRVARGTMSRVRAAIGIDQPR
jgi:tryptophanyl-tRNA synthetase